MTHLRARRPSLTAAFFSTLLAVAACGGNGSSSDGGTGSAALGASCLADSSCASGHCDTSLSGGACVAECSGGQTCPSGSTCAQPPSESASECLVSCTSNTCRLGYECDTGLGVCLPQQGSSGCANGCPSGEACNASGQCISTGGNDGGTGGHDGGISLHNPNPGAACTSDSDCFDGTAPTCITSAMLFPDGYCSGVCATNSDCGTTGTCVTDLLAPAMDGGAPQSGCMEACTSSSDCRTGYICSTAFGPSACLPDDCRFVPTICTSAQGCDQGNGQCASQTSGYPAAFPAPPQVQNSGGGVLKSPKIVAIFFSNDDMTLVPDLEAFYTGIGSSDFWKTLTEYGVGPATATNVILNTPAPAMINDSTVGSPLETDLEGYISSGKVPAPDANTEYILNYPASTTVVDGSGTSSGTSCTFGGYHANMQYNNTDIAYGVIVRCPGEDGFTVEQTFTGSASHELVEAATDPYPDSTPAWSQVDAAHIYFDEANDGSEVGDMCENDPEAFWEFSDFPYVVQRIWSNAAAKAGHDPCVPAYPGEIYFNSIPDFTTAASFSYLRNSYMISTTKIAVGKSGTIPLEFYSDFPLSQPWDIQVQDFNQLETGGNPLLTFSTAASTGSNGNKVNLTVTVNAAGTSPQVANTELFAIIVCSGSCSDSSSYFHLWWGIIDS